MHNLQVFKSNFLSIREKTTSGLYFKNNRKVTRLQMQRGQVKQIWIKENEIQKERRSIHILKINMM